MAIEKIFGVLKRRFPALRMGIRLKETSSIVKFITCAFCLHNLIQSLQGGDDLDDESSDGEGDNENEQEYFADNDVSGEAVRNELCNLLNILQ